MEQRIMKLIEKTYFEKNYDDFKNGCKVELEFISDLCETMRKAVSDIAVSSFNDFPCTEMNINVGEFSDGGFSVKYTSVLSISKVCPAFNLRHEFSVDNIDPNKIDPVLDGFSDEAYNKKQFELDEIVSEYLQNKGYSRLSYAQMSEVIPNISMPKNNLFGNQMTVEYAIFNDLWNICESDD